MADGTQDNAGKDGGGTGDGSAGGGAAGTGALDKDSYTKDEVAKLLEGRMTPEQVRAEADRRANQAAETARKKAEAESAAAVEAERQKQLAAAGKWEELAKAQEARNNELAGKIAAAELRVATSDLLTQMGLSAMAPVFNADMTTLEGRQAAAQSLKTLFDQAVATAVESKLKTGTPAGSGTPPPSGDLDVQIKAAEAKAHQTGQWNEYLSLANKKQEQLAGRI